MTASSSREERKLNATALAICADTSDGAPWTSPPARSWLVLLLVAAGFAMRLPGLFFTGMPDTDQIILEWGAAVASHGVGGGYHGIYGVATYALLGPAYWLAELVPRFWTGPYKLMEVAFEFGVLLALWRISPSRYRVAIAMMYWINPWFAVHGAWQGFWDGPHTLMGLLAVAVLLGREDTPRAWFWVGALLGLSGLFKPQGVVFFVVPATIYLVLQYFLYSRRWIVPFALGGAAVLLLATLLVVATGGGVTSIPRSYADLTTIMPNLSNNSLNIWRTVTVIVQGATGQTGPAYTLRLRARTLSALNTLAGAVTMAAVIAICWRAAMVGGRAHWDAGRIRLAQAIRIPGLVAIGCGALGLLRRSSGTNETLILGLYSARWLIFIAVLLAAGAACVRFAPLVARWIAGFARAMSERWSRHGPAVDPALLSPAHLLLLVLALSAIAMPQLNTRMHINHAYAGLVLLIPFACANRKVYFLWVVMVAIHFICHLTTFRFGRATILPPLSIGYPDAGDLIAALRFLQGTTSGSRLIAVQQWLNDQTLRIVTLNELLNQHIVAGVLSAVMFVAVMLLLRHFLFCPRASRQRARATLDWQTAQG